MVLLVPAVIVVLVIVYTRLFSGPTGTIPVQPTASTTAGLGSSEIDWQEPDLYPNSLRDPMRAGVFINTTTTSTSNNGQGPDTDETAPQLDLRFIMWSDNPSVMIGKEILHEGEELNGIKILKINEHTIELEIDGEKYEQEDKK